MLGGAGGLTGIGGGGAEAGGGVMAVPGGASGVFVATVAWPGDTAAPVVPAVWDGAAVFMLWTGGVALAVWTGGAAPGGGDSGML
jgi:hypothetical protein